MGNADASRSVLSSAVAVAFLAGAGVELLRRLLLSRLPKDPRDGGKFRFIAHRGNLNGINREDENKPAYLTEALRQEFDVELDAWLDKKSGRWFLGHDEPQYEIPYSFLLQKGLWVHAKNGDALNVLAADSRLTCFTHDSDEFTLTSKAHIWTFPDKPLVGPRSIAVMFSKPEEVVVNRPDVYGVCSDNVSSLRDLYRKTHGAHSV